MCIVCENKAPTDYILDCRSCRNIVNDTLKKYVLKHTIKELYCSYTTITEIPHIIGLKYLNCSNTNITKIPDIEGCYIITNNCYWLDKLHIEKVITTQKMIRNYYMRKKLIHIRDQLIPIYFHPEMKGGYLHKKSMLDLFV